MPQIPEWVETIGSAGNLTISYDHRGVITIDDIPNEIPGEVDIQPQDVEILCLMLQEARDRIRERKAKKEYRDLKNKMWRW